LLLEKENLNEVQQHWRNEFGPPPTRVTVTQVCVEFWADGTMQNVSKECSEDLAV
jgi:hypothetical protein